MAGNAPFMVRHLENWTKNGSHCSIHWQGRDRWLIPPWLSLVLRKALTSDIDFCPNWLRRRILLMYRTLVHQFLWHVSDDLLTYRCHWGPEYIISCIIEKAITPNKDGVSRIYRCNTFDRGLYLIDGFPRNWRIRPLAHRNPLNRKNASTQKPPLVTIWSKKLFSPLNSNGLA